MFHCSPGISLWRGGAFCCCLEGVSLNVGFVRLMIDALLIFFQEISHEC